MHSHPCVTQCWITRPLFFRARKLLLPALMLVFVAVCAAADDAAIARPVTVDIGSAGDEAYLVEGFYGREGPNPQSKLPLARDETFRWAANDFVVELPVEPGRAQEVALRALLNRPVLFSAGERWATVVAGQGVPPVEGRFIVPADVIGSNRRLRLRGRAVYPRVPGARDTRELFLLIAGLEVRPLSEEVAKAGTLPPIATPLPESHLDRIRHTERRPPSADPEAFAVWLAAERANLVSLGTMNGRGQVFFPTDLAAMHPSARPGYLEEVIRALRRRDIGVLSWVVFNAQDLRNADDFEPARRYLQWQMQYIDEPGVDYGTRPRVGMCVVSSPYIEHHAKLLRQAAAFDLDGFFFDGFYFGGIPHPSRPGCVCDFCKEKFHADTGLELPTVVDWTSPAFKRWVRWRNDRLLAVARYFQEQIREVNPKATCAFNTNHWPFGGKDWETAVPMWRIDDFGVSQHGYTTDFSQKWLMLGFKARLGRDMNPAHTDLWRTGRLMGTCGPRREPNWAWHELELLTFVLAGPTYGISTWHGGMEGPVELTARIHTEAAKREPYFSRRHLADVGVLASQNTHDFYGHIPGTDNLADYRDSLLGTWSVLTDHHVPFEFLFDNQLPDAETLGRYRTLVLPGTAALSRADTERLARWVEQGGRLITTARTGAYDEWGEPHTLSLLVDLFGIDPARQATVSQGEGAVTHLPADPGLAWTRRRELAAAGLLVDTVRAGRPPLPLEVDGPPWLVANLFLNPDNPAEYWVQLLNVSHKYPAGDAGFRGLGLPVPEDKRRGNDQYGWPLVPIENIRLRLPGTPLAAARLAIAGRQLTPDADGWLTIPRLELHDVVVLKKRDRSDIDKVGNLR